jgi:hypothetical protein
MTINRPTSQTSIHKLDKSNTLITEDLLLELIKKQPQITDDQTITFVSASSGSAVDITIKHPNKGSSIDLSKIKNLKDLNDNGVILEINRGINKNFVVNYGAEEKILGNLVPIQVEQNVSKNLSRQITSNLDQSDISNYVYTGKKQEELIPPVH